MERKFQEELGLLKEEILTMAARVETNVGDAIKALRERNLEDLKDVIGRDAEIDRAEIRIDEHCLYLLALQQPVARDLRFVTTALKLVKDIERIGDISTNIAKHGAAIVNDDRVKIPPDLSTMARSAQTMLTEALDAFVNRDVDLARRVLKADDEVDELHKKMIQQVVEMMVAEPHLIGPMSHIMSVSKFLERVGDHSSNIAEMVVFMVEGKDIRHWEKLRGEKEPWA